MIAQVDDLGHRFDQGWLFRHVAFDLNSGDRLLIQGRNGSGKSTLLKCLVGLMIPREGTFNVPEAIGYAALDQSLYPALNAKEHLELSADLRNCDPQSLDLLTQVGLADQATKPCRTFSTGMRSRLKIALALQQNPSLLILDEPTAALDQSGRDLIHSIMEGFQGAVIYASNDDADARWATHALTL